MPLPELAKTWQFADNAAVSTVNRLVTADVDLDAVAKKLIFELKKILTSFPSSPWTVRGSSDGTTAAAMDGVDRWASAANVVGANPGTNHSWIVLRQTGVHATFEVCIDMTDTQEFQCTTVVSAAGFTGGSLTARPTATDEIVLINDTAWFSTSNSNHYVHAAQSTDGQCTRVVVWRGGTNLCLFWLFDKVKNPVPNWAIPYVAVTHNSQGVAPAYANSMDSAVGAYLGNLLSSGGNSVARGYHAGGSMRLAFTAEGAVQTGSLSLANGIDGIGDGPNEISGEWPMYPFGLASNTSGRKGRHGAVFDLWNAPVGVADGDTLGPSSSERRFVKFGTMWFPWTGDATVPLLA